MPTSIGLCNELKTLASFRNDLLVLPETIGQCTKLVYFFCSNNRFQSLPSTIGLLGALEALNLSANAHLAGLPSEILNLSRKCAVDITNTGLSQQVLSHLRESTESPGYSGPRFSISMTTANPTLEEVKPLPQLLQELYSHLGQEIPPSLGILTKDPAISENLHIWISRLSWTADSKQEEFKKGFYQNIADILEQACNDKTFRDVFSSVLNEASETCGDRVTLSVLHLGILRKLATLDLSNLKEVSFFLTRGVWAMSLLETIARNKIPTLRFFDEVEVYLGYPIMLKKALDLPIEVEQMLYFTCSALTEKDLKEAEEYVLSHLHNREATCDFLATQEKWIEALNLHYPERALAIKQRKEALLSKTSATEDYKRIIDQIQNLRIRLTAEAYQSMT